MNISLRQLKVFLAVARLGNFSRAGDEVGLTQPAVSRCIRELEGELGLKLIDRTTREAALTDVGTNLAGTLERVLDELETVLLETRGMGEQRRGRVRVASSPTISANLMPECISRCNTLYPDITLVLRDQVQALALDSVRRGEVDFGVVIEPMDGDDLALKPILVEPFYVVFRDDHRFAALDAVRWDALDGEHLVLLDYASGSRPLIDRALGEHRAACDIVQQLGHSTTVFRMVDAGIGISVIPALALPIPEPSRLVVRPLVPQIDRTIMLVQRKNRSLSPAAEAVWDLIEDVARQAAPR